MPLHTEVLNKAQNAILPTLGLLASSHGFYLAGGTAVALHLGHRHSVDFDWFTQNRIEDPMALAGQLRQTDFSVDEIQVAPGSLHAIVGGIRVSYFEYPYPRIGVSTIWQEYSFELMSLDDLACMKLVAIAQRGSRKDFVDLYLIAIQHKPIQEMLHLYQLKYQPHDIVHVLTGLTYFDDADKEPSPLMLCDISWDQVKSAFRQWVKELAR